MARARRGASSLRKMPLPTNTASAPSAMQSAASAGVAIPPAAKYGTGRRPSRATWRHELEAGPELLRLAS